MYHHTTTLTTFGIKKLRSQFDYLKERYERITQDLKDKTQSQSILASKRIEREIISSDMLKVETILSNATILERSARPQQVEQGAKVTYVQENTGEKHVITLVDPLEADPLEGFISVQSPVGSALIGCQIDDSVIIITPKVRLRITVLDIE
ncbi:Transcription elongation factor GreA [compost metagenome]|jgi:transcription elongation factor GreA